MPSEQLRVEQCHQRWILENKKERLEKELGRRGWSRAQDGNEVEADGHDKRVALEGCTAQ